ncbi:MAG: hypothetical protein NTX47_01300 [Candidatus Omnitrophica bacterium]|nr:hypothetical protein [Candidatus Omnitrophota bacterium]
MDKVGKFILSMIIIFMATPLCDDNILEPIPMIKHVEDASFCDCVNTVKRDTEDDADTLRAEWKEALGVDIFFAYFKTKEITNKIEEKSKFKLFSMRGKATIKKNSATYAFSRKF